ncbi:MAG: TetR family transcriptional regulator [Actinomycetota bacterium]|nr:TetR family transcriptional regulator [Actinomycetota bacterium]
MAGRRRDTQTPLRIRLVQQASELTSNEGWSAVTMARLAEVVGVSRQTVYNEVGGKPALAEAMVLHELALFLGQVDDAFATNLDVVDAIRAASRGVLETARTNPLLRAILSASHGAGTDLLPLLTTHSEALLETATTVIRGHLDRFDLDIEGTQLDVGIDMVVRLVLSHVMQPGDSPARTADDIAWIADQVLRPAPAPA